MENNAFKQFKTRNFSVFQINHPIQWPKPAFYGKISAIGGPNMDQNFTRSVLSWYDAGHRDLPWRHTKDAYRIWISEIMLQQTRAETVVSYYERFLARYPDVYALADAPEEELLKAWEGLGYYSRARSLQKAGKTDRFAAWRRTACRFGEAARAARHRGLYQRRDCFHCVRHSGCGGGWQRGARRLSVFCPFRGDGQPEEPPHDSRSDAGACAA